MFSINSALLVPARTYILRGHSTTMWTRFYPILTPLPPRVDRNGHFTYYLPFVTWPFWTFYWPPTPSTCPRSYWMPPKFKKRPLTSAKFYKRVMISAPSKIYPPSRNFHSFIATLCSVKKHERKFIRLNHPFPSTYTLAIPFILIP